MTEQELNDLKRMAISSGEKIEDSRIFLTILSKSYKEDPVCALQLGIAILLGKPIAVVTVDNEPVPPALKKMAFAIENINFKDDSSVAQAMTRIVKAMES